MMWHFRLTDAITTAVVYEMIVGQTNSLFVDEMQRIDGYKISCQESNYFAQFSAGNARNHAELDHYAQFYHNWSPQYIDNLTNNYKDSFYYIRIQIIDGVLNYEYSDFWRPDYQPDHFYPERVYSTTLENIVDYVQYLIINYKQYIPNIDFLVLGSNSYYGYPSYFSIDYPIFKFESSNVDSNVYHWLLPTREYVQYWNLCDIQNIYNKLVIKNEDSNKFELNTEHFIPWRDRIDLAVFRGAVYFSNTIRYQLLKMVIDSINNGSLRYFDIKMTAAIDMNKNDLIRDNYDIIGLDEDKKMSDIDQMKYKFIIVAGMYLAMLILTHYMALFRLYCHKLNLNTVF